MTQPSPSPSGASSAWDTFQSVYWDTIAKEYDDLYSSGWSCLENRLFERRLGRLLAAEDVGLVLDIGCGRGLVFEALRRCGSLASYVGVDLSSEMLAHSVAPKGTVARMAMDKLGIADGTADLVIASFSAASYAEDLPALFAETARVLRPGGFGYFSFLSCRSLSRLRSSFGPVYRTRGDTRRWAVAPARRVTPGEVQHVAGAAGLLLQSCQGVNAFAGLVETEALWGSGRSLSRLVPSLSHTIELVVRAR